MTKKRFMVAAVITLILISMLGGSTFVKITNAESKTIVVPTDYPTIQQAINAAADGDTVFVKNGIYNETLMINKTLSLIGEDRDLTILDAQKSHSPAITIQGSNILVINFTLGNTAYGPATSKYWSPTPGEGTGITIFAVSNYVTITNNTIIGCGFAGIQMYFSKYNLVTDNTFIENPYAVSVECIYSTIANNTFANSSGIYFPSIYIATSEGTWMVNESNTIYGNQNNTLASIPSPFPKITSSPSPVVTISISPTPTIPEFPAFISIPILSAILAGTIIYKRKLRHKNDQKDCYE